MTEHCEIKVYGDRVLFSLKGKEVPEFEKGLEEVFDYISQENESNPEAYLQTFVDVTHREELDFFLRNGLYINNTMLFMELDLEKFAEELTAGDRKSPEGNMLTGSDISDPVTFETYDISRGLKEYLSANGLGFGEPDPENMIKEELSNPGACIYVARVENSGIAGKADSGSTCTAASDGGGITASVTVWEMSPGVYATENIFTIPEFRNKHLAREMMRKALLTISVNGAKKARLSVFGDDYEALGLYYGLGFELKEEKYELRY